MSDKSKTICGIIMPISAVDDVHTAAHWQKVKLVVEEAIKKAGCTPRPVWEAGDFEVIQGGILQNLFEDEIAICDISTRNPNVMLEWGMRLTTRKPTLVIAEQGTPLPFDTSIVKTKFYDPKMEWPEASKFIDEFSESILNTLDGVRAGTYKPYLEHFQFETVQPGTVTVTAEEKIENVLERISSRLDGLEGALTRKSYEDDIIRSLSRPSSTFYTRAGLNNALATAVANEKLHLSDEQLANFKSHLLTFPVATANDPPEEDLNVFPRVTLMPEDRVNHAEHGVGTVLAVKGDKADVRFGNVTRKVNRTTLSKLPL